MLLKKKKKKPIFKGLYDGETMIWKEKEMSRIRSVQMDNLRGLLGIRRMYRVPNALIREFPE